MESMQWIQSIGVVPVVTIADSSQAVPLAQALCKGGIPVAEITFRTAAAAQSLRLIACAIPELLVGAGTIRDVPSAQLAVECGAKFIMTPGFYPPVVQWCIEHGVPVFPGCVTPAEFEAAMDLGLDTVKFFPAEVYGGVKAIKAFSQPYQGLKFLPTGGINPSNINDYLSMPNIVACGGSWMVPQELIAARQFDRITALCEETVAKILQFELVHVGINTSGEREARQVAETLAHYFLKPVIEGEKAFFAGTMAEVIKEPFLGTNGHLAILTNHMQRALHHFARKGIEVDINSSVYDNEGNLQVIYLAQEVGGYAVHLKQRTTSI